MNLYSPYCIYFFGFSMGYTTNKEDALGSHTHLCSDDGWELLPSVHHDRLRRIGRHAR